MGLILNIIITALASLGCYHIFEEIAWQKHIKANPEEVKHFTEMKLENTAKSSAHVLVN